jgi:actin-related protein 8
VRRDAQTEEETGVTGDDLLGKIDGLRTDLKIIMRNLKLRGLGNGRQQAASYNANVTAEIVPEHNDVFAIDWTESGSFSKNVVIGERAVRMDCFSSDKDESTQWKLFHPIVGGHFNMEQYIEHYGTSSGPQALVNDLRTIWTHAITSPRESDTQRKEASEIIDVGLGIAARDWPKYNVVLVIPDLYIMSEVEELVRLLLDDMGFAGILIQQEGVCATFGAGLSSSCVVHIGGDRTTISCVEEGLIVAESRMTLNYGGRNVSRFFLQLLQRSNFPYRLCDINKRLADYWLAEQLKERLCTLDAAQLGLIISDFHLRLPKQKTKKFALRTYDEIILAPMALFTPRVFFSEVELQGKQSKGIAAASTPAAMTTTTADAPEDEVEEGEPVPSIAGQAEVQITTAMTLCIRHLLPATPTAVIPPVISAAASSVPMQEAPSAQGTPAPVAAPSNKAPEPLILEPITLSGPSLTPGNMTPVVKDDDLSLASEGVSPAPPTTVNKVANSKTAVPVNFDVPSVAGKVPLDFAVWNSIQASISNLGSAGTSEERIRRMSGNIIITGGTAFVPGLGFALEARLNNYLAQWFTSQGKDLHSSSHSGATVVPPPRDMDPRILSWKGMSVLARLDGAQEMWIPRQDWQMFGVRALKEKSLFL